MFSFEHKGDLNKTERFLKRLLDRQKLISYLNEYGRRGVEALSLATPVDTGLTAASWSYEVEQSKNTTSIHWTNSNINQGVQIAIILQYGHGTGTGGYVQGVDYINPALKPIFDEIANGVMEVIKSG